MARANYDFSEAISSSLEGRPERKAATPEVKTDDIKSSITESKKTVQEKKQETSNDTKKTKSKAGRKPTTDISNLRSARRSILVKQGLFDQLMVYVNAGIVGNGLNDYLEKLIEKDLAVNKEKYDKILELKKGI